MHDFLIVGGGLIGLLTARELHEAGARVTLVERGQVGQESSWAGGGILSPLYPWKYPQAVNTLTAWSQQHYPQLVADLQAGTGIDAEWIDSGLLILDEQEIPAALRWARQSGARLETPDSAQIQDIEPAVGQRSAGGVWLPDVAQVRNPKLLQALRADLQTRGVELVQNTEVTGLSISAQRITGVRTPDGERSASQVVIAGGAWSAKLLQELDHQPPIEPVRGQMILLRTAPGTLQRILIHRGYYAIPRRDGRVLVGSTTEHVGFDKRITEAAGKELAAAAVELAPVLKTARLEKHWAGLRPGSRDGVPYIGPHPQIAGLYVNTGHYRNGVVMAPASAKLLVDMILERPLTMDSVCFQVLRDKQ